MPANLINALFKLLYPNFMPESTEPAPSDEFHLHYAQNSLMFWLPPANGSLPGRGQQWNHLCRPHFENKFFRNNLCVCASAQYLNCEPFIWILSVGWLAKSSAISAKNVKQRASGVERLWSFGWLALRWKLKALKISSGILGFEASTLGNIISCL